jgi:hypothetical protein
MTIDLTVAVLADWLPRFDAPFGENGFATPYRNRMKLELSISESDTLQSVYERAIAHWQPVIAADSQVHPEHLIEAAYWCWFYEPQDENGLEGRYERARDLILIDEQGHAVWNLPMSEIPYGHILRAGDRGLLRGDPRRPYLPMLWPQGGGELQFGWEAMVLTWHVLEGLLVARGAIALGAEGRRRLLGRLRRRKVAEDHGAQLEARGGDPHNVARTIDRTPWEPEELRMVMGVPTAQDAEDLLALFGYEPSAGGTFQISETDEARILRLAEEDVFRTFRTGVTDEQLRPRLERLLQTGQTPGYEPPEH